MTLECDSGAFVKEEYAMVQCTCCTRRVPGKIIHWPDMDPEVKVLAMPCKSCSAKLSHREEDDKKLNGKCLDCFKEEQN